MPGKLFFSPSREPSSSFPTVQYMLQKGSPLHVLPIAPLFQVAVVEAVVVLFKLLVNSLVFLAKHTWTQPQKGEKPPKSLLSPRSAQALQWLESPPTPAPTPAVSTNVHTRTSSADSLESNPGALLGGQEFELVPSDGERSPGNDGVLVSPPEDDVRSLDSNDSLGSEISQSYIQQQIESPGLPSDCESWDDLGYPSDDSQTAATEAATLIENYEQQENKSPR